MIMRVCFPVEKADGLNSTIYGHFGSAPCFLIIDTESRSTEEVDNTDKSHQHGQCRPTQAIQGKNVDAILVTGIGRGAMAKLEAEGIKVLKAQADSIAENLVLLDKGQLRPIDEPCGHGHQHAHNHGCG
jgi:predicted Fe-Mo cluster-binding NifX family protein